MKRFTILLTLLTACASVPNSVAPTPAIVREAGLCLQLGPCTVVQVRNSNFYDAVIYLNAAKIGEVTGNHDTPLFIRDSQLRNGRCAIVVVRLIAPGTVKSTTQECVPLGGHYQLDIDPSSNLMPLHVWLTPRDGGGR